MSSDSTPRPTGRTRHRSEWIRTSLFGSRREVLILQIEENLETPLSEDSALTTTVVRWRDATSADISTTAAAVAA